ncbi:MAG: DEAD/DEAH box helicase [Myxococcaceae bacterium]|nr:MAG: DEAD/DEAH box helicase [Myxococcaceae bacterium]
MSEPSFSSLGLSSESQSFIARAGYHVPTPIQARAIPPALAGKDVIGCAATGTGKTAAFVLPLVERLAGKQGTRALVLAPTRELATQIDEHAARFGAARGVRTALVIGGVSIGPQQLALHSRPQLVIATPGRLIDHLESRNVSFRDIELLVLDEADRMLDMGFKPQLTRILAAVPRDRQTLLFSATMAGEVADFARTHLRNPTRVEVSRSGTTSERAEQRVYRISQAEKPSLLLALLAEDDLSTLIFTRTKHRTDKLARMLERAGHRVSRLHSNRSQNQRQLALEGFKEGKFRVLVATDIAARGIDVAEIGHVVNFDLPHVPEDYVHRIGRTARMAASGKASSFCGPEETGLLRDIERLMRKPVPQAEVPLASPVFQSEMSSAAARMADPGPRQAGHGVSGRPAGQLPGRHARSHPRRDRPDTRTGGPEPRGAVLFSGSPRRRR